MPYTTVNERASGDHAGNVGIVARGGAFNSPADEIAPAYRTGLPADRSNQAVGFPVVVSSHHPLSSGPYAPPAMTPVSR